MVSSVSGFLHCSLADITVSNRSLVLWSDSLCDCVEAAYQCTASRAVLLDRLGFQSIWEPLESSVSLPGVNETKMRVECVGDSLPLCLDPLQH